MGDGWQIPLVQTGLRGRGAFQIPQSHIISDIERNGEAKFFVLAQTVVTLKKNQGVSNQCSQFRKILERLRVDEKLRKMLK